MIWKSKVSRSIHYKLYSITLLTLPKYCEISKLEQKFADIVHDPQLKPLSQVIQGLMRFFIIQSHYCRESTRINMQQSSMINQFKLTKAEHVL